MYVIYEHQNRISLVYEAKPHTSIKIGFLWLMRTDLLGRNGTKVQKFNPVDIKTNGSYQRIISFNYHLICEEKIRS